MLKRITISIAAAALFAVPAQSASAAISAGERPLAQEMEHGIAQPAVEQGVSSSPGAPEDGAVESSGATPVDQGISTSPGIATPATDPSVPEIPEAQQEQQEEAEEDTDTASACEATQEAIQDIRQTAITVVWLMEEFEGTRAGDFFGEWMDSLQGELDVHKYDLKQDGCDSGETAE